MAQQLCELVAACWLAVHDANEPPRVFRAGTEIVRVRVGRSGLQVSRFTPAAMRAFLSEAATFIQECKNEDKPKFPPGAVVTTMLDAPDERLPQLEGAVDTPILSRDWKIITQNRYYPKMGFLVMIPSELRIGPIPEKPTAQDVEKAIDLILNHLLVDFKFHSQADLAHMIGLLILPFVIFAINGPTPIHFLDSPVPGTGKTLLAEITAWIATGRRAQVAGLKRSEDENAKVFISYLLAGQRIILLDNLDEQNVLHSGRLAATLTGETISERLLGGNRTASVPNRAAWIATGNNIPLAGDIARRSVRIRLEASTEHPHLRSGFKHPRLKQWVAERRPALIRFTLILVQNWLAQGRPKFSGKVLGSFEQWADVIGGILQANGIEGFLGNLDDFYLASDTESLDWSGFVKAWATEFGENMMPADRLLKFARKHNLLGGVITKGTDRRAFGKKLNHVRDRVYGEHRIIMEIDHANNCARYRLEAVPGTAAGEPGTGDTAVPVSNPKDGKE